MKRVVLPWTRFIYNILCKGRGALVCRSHVSTSNSSPFTVSTVKWYSRFPSTVLLLWHMIHLMAASSNKSAGGRNNSSGISCSSKVEFPEFLLKLPCFYLSPGHGPDLLSLFGRTTPAGFSWKVPAETDFLVLPSMWSTGGVSLWSSLYHLLNIRF